jgi:hypothetical protein
VVDITNPRHPELGPVGDATWYLLCRGGPAARRPHRR